MPKAPSAWRKRLLLFAAFFLLTGVTQARTILVVAPHPDDEALCCSGVIYRALQHGDTVYVVVMTNGNNQGLGPGWGLKRESETVAGMRVLGLDEQHIIFLGYGNGLTLTLYRSSDPNQVYTSSVGLKQTYGNRGLGGVDYHYYLHGVHGFYNRSTMMQDVTAALRNIRPDDIYTTGIVDGHVDHQAAGLAVMEAIRTVQSSDPTFQPRLHETVIHAPNEDPLWPEAVFTPTMPFATSQYMAQTPLDWTQIESIPVPAVMQDLDLMRNLKGQAIDRYRSQISQGFDDWLFSFVKQNEYFWVQTPSLNVALRAAVTDSSEAQGGKNAGTKAIDGEIPDQFGAYIPVHNRPLTEHEWVTNKQLAGAWIRLSWSKAVTVNEVKLSDRPDPRQNVLAGTLTFSDGSSTPVGALPIYGTPYPIVFPAKTITWVKFTITEAQGTATGLDEFQVLVPSTPVPIAVALSPSDVVTGESFQGSVVLSAPNPNSDTAVHLVSDSDAVKLPATAIVPAGATSGTFRAAAVSSAPMGPVKVTARVNDVSQEGILEVVPAPTLVGISLDNDNATGGTTVHCTITVEAPVRADTIVSLTNLNSAARVPATATIGAGTVTTTFAIPTSSVTHHTIGAVTACYKNRKISAYLAVEPSFTTLLVDRGRNWIRMHRRRAAAGLLLSAFGLAMLGLLEAWIRHSPGRTGLGGRPNSRMG